MWLMVAEGTLQKILYDTDSEGINMQYVLMSIFLGLISKHRDCSKTLCLSFQSVQTLPMKMHMEINMASLVLSCH